MTSVMAITASGEALSPFIICEGSQPKEEEYTRMVCEAAGLPMDTGFAWTKTSFMDTCVQSLFATVCVVVT